MASLRYIDGKGYRLEWCVTVRKGPQAGKRIRGSELYKLLPTAANLQTMTRIKAVKETELISVRLGDLGPAIPFDRFLDDYAAHKRQNKTIGIAVRDLRDLARITGIKTIKDFTGPRIQAYIDHRRKNNTTDPTVRKFLSNFGAAMTFAVRKKLISDHCFISREITLPDKPKPRERFLTRPEFSQFLRTCRARDPKGQSGFDRYHAMRFAWHCIFIVNTGLRISEYITAKPGDLYSDRIRVHGKGKRGQLKTRVVPLNHTARRALTHLTAAKKEKRNEFIFDFCNRHSWKNKYDRHFKRADLTGIGPHVLRKTFGSWLAMSGVPLATIAAIMGHSNIQTTIDHYLWLTPDYLANSTRSLRYHCR